MSILSWIYNFLLDLFVHHKYSGELTVAGKDEVQIELHCSPDYANVFFEDDASHAPCDPGSADAVDYEVRQICCEHDCIRRCKCCKQRKRWYLIIKWSVAGTRKIVWEVQA
jgi:hypothetical protein